MADVLLGAGFAAVVLAAFSSALWVLVAARRHRAVNGH